MSSDASASQQPVLANGQSVTMGYDLYHAACVDRFPKDAQVSALDKADLMSLLFASSTKLSLLWDHDTTITYAYVDGIENGNDKRRHKVDVSVAKWSDFANIKFLKVELTEKPMIRIRFDHQGGNTTYVGKENLQIPEGQHTMNIACLGETDDYVGGEKYAIRHQFGHVLGLTHEHPAGMNLDENVTETLCKELFGWTKEQVKANILDVYNSGNEVTNFRQFDAKSLMRFPVRKEQVLARQEVGVNAGFSEQDMAWLVIHYPLPQPSSNELTWTLEHALDISGVPAAKKAGMLASPSQEVRKEYAKWLADYLHEAPKPAIPPKPVEPEPAPESTGDEPAVEDPPSLPEWIQRTCKDILKAQQKKPFASTPSAHLLAVMANSSLLWPNGSNITYSYLPGRYQGTKNQQDKVDRVIKEWSLYANITFTRIAVGEETDIRITFDTSVGSWSYVGNECSKFSQNEATMNFGWVYSNPTLTANETGVILHEFGHALGMLHEHQSPARGGAITLNEEAVYKVYARDQGWSPEVIKQQVIDVYHTRDISNYSKLDTSSVMMYFMPPELNQQKINVPVNNKLSMMDKAFMVINYPRQSPPPGSPEWTLSYALEYVGVDAKTQKDILTNSADADTVRQLFSGWNATQHTILHHAPAPPVEPRKDPLQSVAPPGPDVPDQRDWCAMGRSAEISGNSADLHGPSHAVTVVNSSLWLPGDVIKYWFQQKLYQGPIADGLFEPRVSRVERLLSAFKEYEAVANIKFVEAQSESDSDVRIWFRESDSEQERSWCFIAKACKDPTKKNDPSVGGGNERTTFYLTLPRIGPQIKNRAKAEDTLNRYCRHEVGHLLGLLHEHASSDAKAVTKVPPSARTTDFDPKSIMLYPKVPPNKAEELMPKLNDKDVEESERNILLSEKDKAFLQAIYPTTSDRLGAALKTLGITQQQEILDAFASAGARKSDDPSGYAISITKLRALLVSDLHEASARPLQGLDPSRPALRAPLSGAEPASSAQPRLTDGGFLTQIISTLQQFFAPGGGQIFTLQFPGRFLQMTEYAWDTKTAGVYGQVVKPLAVNESEFRLTDQLYDVADVVSGPNGIALSQVYEQVLNNLLPAYRPSKLNQHQEKIRGWLMKDVQATGWVQELIAAQQAEQAASPMSPARALAPPKKSPSSGPKPAFAPAPGGSAKTISRIELSNALMQEYLVAKNAWEKERDGMLSKALKLKMGSEESAEALNDLTRELAHVTAQREAQLAAKYNDAVVRGYSHNVREYMGYLDVKSPAESLQEAKDSLRESSMSSFDGSLRVYPVQMGPIDWFEGLSTSFTLEDLTSDPELIEQQIEAKSQELDVLNSQLTALRFGTKGTIEEYREKTTRAQAALDDAQARLAASYTNNVLAMAKTCFDKAGVLDDIQLTAIAKRLNLTATVLTQLKADLEATSLKQQELTNASRAFTQASAGLALAEATDSRQQQEVIKQKVAKITGELKELTSRYTSLNSVGKRPVAVGSDQLKAVEDVPLFSEASESSGGSRWQQIQVHHKVVSDYSSQGDKSSAKSSSSHCNLWLFSSGHSSSSSSASSETRVGSSENEVHIGFRATLITVDRAGWFRPQFFKQSGTFYHIDDNLSWSKWPEGVKNMNELKAKKDTTFPKINESLLPAFPVGYIVCKDITIKIRNASSESGTNSSTMKEDCAASGGVLCFSYSQSSSSSQSSNSRAFQACSNGCIIRIPGPQILGYIMQLTENDRTGPIPDELPEDFLVVPADDKPKPMSAVQPPPTAPHDPLVEQIQALLKQAHLPADTLASVRNALQKELDDIVKQTS